MLFSYAEKNSPLVLSPESLDEHLAKGWYRMGSSIFTTHFLFFNGRPYSAIWIRVDLKDFKFSKSQRKLMRRNAALFNISVAPMGLSEERETLYTLYANDFDGKISPSIADNLECHSTPGLFNTYEVMVRDRVSGQLVANSYFDLGETSTASILGIYKPEMRSFSLGYYTMLLEMEYCLEQGMRYYYPGYVVPGYQRFDYKLRLGTSEYYDLQTNTWKTFSKAEIEANGPTELQLARLSQLTGQLTSMGIERQVLTYPLFEADLYDIWHDNYLPDPYFVFLGRGLKNEPVVLVFDPKEESYLLLQCAHLIQTQLLYNANYLNKFSEAPFYNQLLSIQGILYRTNSQAQMAATIAQGLRVKPS